MFAESKSTKEIKPHEHNHGEKPLLDQLAALDWELIGLDRTQHPSDTYRQLYLKKLDLSAKCYSLCDINRL